MMYTGAVATCFVQASYRLYPYMRPLCLLTMCYVLWALRALCCPRRCGAVSVAVCCVW